MKSTRNCMRVGAAVTAAVVALFVAPSLTPAFAQNNTDPNGNVAPFDFSNDFYTRNGIDVGKLTPFPAPDVRNNRVGFDIGGTPNSPENGVNAPSFSDVGKPVPGNWIVDNSITDPTRTNVRVLQTTGGFDKDGNLIYYDIFGVLQDDSIFLNDADCPTFHSTGVPDVPFTNCGTRAKTLAQQFRAFISPRQKKKDLVTGVVHLFFPDPGCTTLDPNTVNGPNGTTHPEATVVDNTCLSAMKADNNLIVFAPPPPNRRQDNIFDTQPTYFCQNLLGLWILTMDVWTSQAYNPDGSFASTAAANTIGALGHGMTIDGTAVVETTAEVDSLTSQGFLQQFVIPGTTHTGPPRYVI